MFLIAGPLSSAANYGSDLSASGWTACPDNLCFDPKGRMWIASDQSEAQPKIGIGDGV